MLFCDRKSSKAGCLSFGLGVCLSFGYNGRKLSI